MEEMQEHWASLQHATRDRLNFTMVYTSPSDIGFKQNAYGDRIVPGGLLGAATIALSHHKPWVDLRVRIDKQPAVATSSEEDYRNEATIFFSAGETFPLGPIQSAGLRSDAFAANLIIVELPLGNGVPFVLELKPQDPSFRTFASRCVVKTPTTLTNPLPNLLPRVTTTPGGRGGVTTADRTFTGPVSEFIKVLPEYVNRFAVANSLDPRMFNADVKSVIAMAQACAALTPSVLAANTDASGRINFQLLDKRYGACIEARPSFKPGELHVWSPRPNPTQLRNRLSDGTFKFQVFIAGRVFPDNIVVNAYLN